MGNRHGPDQGACRRAFAACRRALAAWLIGGAACGHAAGAAPTTATAAPATATATATAQIVVDIREAPRGIMKAHLALPVVAGPLTLLYPKWLPGRHAPAGPITSLAGPRLTANGAAVPWHRDLVEPYAFHLEVPAGVTTLDVDLELLTATAPDGIVQGLETPRYATESLAILEWNQVLLYPAGPPTDTLRYQAEVRLPDGWRFATALDTARETADGARFEPTSLTTLVDSTLIAGRYLHTYALGGSPPVRLDIAIGRDTAFDLKPSMLEHYKTLVVQARALFGATHYRHYDFLWTLDDQIMPDGLEHHESSDDRSPLRTLEDDDVRRAEANLLPHEYTHSWNGKYRRPADLATPDYQTPMREDLLWVYEGLTEYLSDVLAVRSGLYTPEEFHDELARLAAQMDVHHGRDWRSLEDTLAAAPLVYYQDTNWAARLRRQDDFYQESALLWLEADTLIRRLSKGKRSLDDFCRRFFGDRSTPPAVVPYGFADVTAALDAVQPYDWQGFWRERLQRTGGGAPLAGIEAAGWRLEYAPDPSTLHAAHEREDKDFNLQYSLGFIVAEDGGTISDVVPGSPADLAGAAPGSHLIAVNGHKWSRDVLHDAITAASRPATVTLLIEKDDEYRTLVLNYAGGERYPTLARTPGSEDLLALIARPRSAATP
jgi:predicted metalloprotease with PDZ domain